MERETFPNSSDLMLFAIGCDRYGTTLVSVPPAIAGGYFQLLRPARLRQAVLTEGHTQSQAAIIVCGEKVRLTAADAENAELA